MGSEDQVSSIPDHNSNVIITDRRVGLEDSLNSIFPLSKKIVCSRHVGLNAKKDLAVSDIDSFNARINQMAKSTNLEQYINARQQLLDDCKEDPDSMAKVVAYLEDSRQWSCCWAMAQEFGTPPPIKSRTESPNDQNPPEKQNVTTKKNAVVVPTTKE